LGKKKGGGGVSLSYDCIKKKAARIGMRLRVQKKRRNKSEEKRKERHQQATLSEMGVKQEKKRVRPNSRLKPEPERNARNLQRGGKCRQSGGQDHQTRHIASARKRGGKRKGAPEKKGRET